MGSARKQTAAQSVAHADYLARLMPRLGKNMITRISKPKLNFGQDLTQGQLTILFYLTESGTLTMRELAHMGQVSMSTMTETIARLVNLKLVSRQHDEKDRRSIRVKMTPKGNKAFECKIHNSRELFQQMLGTLTEKDQRELVRAFQSIERILVKPQF